MGRRPFVDGLGLETLKITLEKSGTIPTNDTAQVAPNIWAIGDCIKGSMLAHKAEEEGVAGQNPQLDHDLIPSVVYTSPEIAWVGQTEEQLSKAVIPYKIGQFPLSANSRGRASDEKDGFVKIISHMESDLILGVHIIGSGAGELIGEACLAMAMSASSEDIARTCHAHPTISEAIRQAAMDVEGWAMQK